MPSFSLPADLTKDQRFSVLSVAAAVGVAVAVGVATLAVYSTRSRKSEAEARGLKEIPVPSGSLPYFGHLLSLGDFPGHQITKWNQEYGPIIRVNMGVKQWVMISDPYLAHEIFVTNGSVTSGRPWQLFSHEIYSVNQRGVVFPNPGRRWKKTRTAALDVLAPKNVDRFSDILDYEADSIIETLLEDSAANAGLYPVKYFQAAAMNVVLTTILGKRATSMKDPLFLEVVTAVDKGMKFAGVANDVSSFLPILSIMDFLVRKERNMRNFIKNERDPLYKRLIKEALESDKDCLLKSLYKLKEEYELDDTGILITINDLIAAGADTIGVTLSWIVSILCHHPEVQAKMREEVDAFISAHKRLPTFAERENFPYFISVQKECMRYRPTTPFGLLHEATEDFVVRGYYIPKGTTLVSNMQGMHLNPDVYPEPGKFIPERFMNNIRTMSAAANSRIENRDHYNFGWGRRICPGIHLAEVEIYNVLIRIIAKSVIEPALDAQGKPQYPNLDDYLDGGLVTLPNNPRIRFTKRSDALI